MTFYISIGNSDDKLSQQEWAEFVTEVHDAIDGSGAQVHGRWSSYPDAPWQNACWCIELTTAKVSWLRRCLATLAQKYRQDSIAWAEAPVTEFLS